MSKFYAVCLLIACLAAAMLGFAVGGMPEENHALESARAPYTDQASSSFTDYNEYEQHVADVINDRTSTAKTAKPLGNEQEQQ